MYSRYKFKHYLVGNKDEKKKGQQCQYVAWLKNILIFKGYKYI
jgi:hypothetical protein